jgi:dTMP kinase
MTSCSPVSRAVRLAQMLSVALLVSGDAARWTAHEEALLFAAARLNHLNHTIRPALARGALVICDRYFDSTRAYQVGGSDLAPAVLDALNAQIHADIPDLTLVLDIDPSPWASSGRAVSMSAKIGSRRKTQSFHARVRAEFLNIAAREPARCATIDASQDAAAVLREALRIIEARL